MNLAIRSLHTDFTYTYIYIYCTLKLIVTTQCEGYQCLKVFFKGYQTVIIGKINYFSFFTS